MKTKATIASRAKAKGKKRMIVSMAVVFNLFDGCANA